MSARATARCLLAVAGLYDGLLGLAFLLAAPPIFRWCAVPAPNHWGYVHFAAAELVIFGLMFWAAALRPEDNRKLIVFGMLLKLAYVGVTGFHWATGSVPPVFKVFLFLDAVWFVALGWVLAVASRPVKR